MNDEIHLVIENGSATCKAGFGGQDSPSVLIPSVVGYAGSTQNRNDFFIGEAAQKQREQLHLEFPIQRGVIHHWENMEKIYHHIFTNELRVSPEDSPILLSETPSNPLENREKVTQLMFETFNVPSMHLCNSAVLSLYASGKTVGVSVEVGYEVTHAVSIYNGFPCINAVSTSEVSGRDLTNYMMELLHESNKINITPDIAQDIKEKYAYVPIDYYDETTEERSYTLPDSQVIRIGSERFTCPEALFHPSKIGKQCLGLDEMVYKCITKSDIDRRMEFYKNITLTGGSTMLPGIAERLNKNLYQIAPSGALIRIAVPQRNVSAWIGGSILASLSFFKNCLVSKEEYDEFGPVITNVKCF